MPSTRLSATSRRTSKSATARDRRVDEEDPLPADVLGEHAAEKNADGGARAGDRAEDAERLVALRSLRERDERDREDRGREDRAAGALQRARGDQHPVRVGEAAEEREDSEEGEPDHEEPAPPEQVADRGRQGAGSRRT